mmetsp:Transcript_9265/g.27874  ORF Transcript_9265/g.27874 Transcript_9265/m.27874 type:complete len:155 (-) Transcript_9265:2625-3089(-)
MGDPHVWKGWVTLKAIGGKDRRWIVLRHSMLSCFDSDDSLVSNCLWSVCIEGAKVNAYTTTNTFKIIVMPKVLRFTLEDGESFMKLKVVMKAAPATIREIARGASSMDAAHLEQIHLVEAREEAAGSGEPHSSGLRHSWSNLVKMPSRKSSERK